jgi:hypothetical protein
VSCSESSRPPRLVERGFIERHGHFRHGCAFGCREIELDKLAPVTYLQAAESVLRSAKKVLSTREVVELALARGLIRTRGKTPLAWPVASA